MSAQKPPGIHRGASLCSVLILSGGAGLRCNQTDSKGDLNVGRTPLEGANQFRNWSKALGFKGLQLCCFRPDAELI